jgi:hypothetical protein
MVAVPSAASSRFLPSAFPLLVENDLGNVLGRKVAQDFVLVSVFWSGEMRILEETRALYFSYRDPQNIE